MTFRANGLMGGAGVAPKNTFMENTKVQFTSVLQKFESDLWGFHFAAPAEVVAKLPAGRRVVCRLNDVLEFQCGLMPKGDGSFFINVNKANRDKLKLKVGQPLEVALWPDDSEYGLPMPEELAELLAQDELGNDYFQALTPGRQRTLLFLAGQPKRSETRLKRAIAIVEFLKANEGRLNFKALRQAMSEG